MIAIIFEVTPNPGMKDDYLSIAAEMRGPAHFCRDRQIVILHARVWCDLENNGDHATPFLVRWVRPPTRYCLSGL